MIQTKEVILFVTDDGREFHDREDAKKHDALLKKIQQIQTLPPRRNIPSGKWIQHPIEQYRKWRIALVKLTMEYLPRLHTDVDPMKIHPFSSMGRCVNDSGLELLRNEWGRLQCTSDDGREYEQPYYALHPDKAEGPMA